MESAHSQDPSLESNSAPSLLNVTTLKRLSATLTKLEAAVKTKRWAAAKGLMDDFETTGKEMVPKDSFRLPEAQKLLARRANAVAPIHAFDEKLLEVLYQRIMVDDFLEPNRLTALQAADWEIAEAQRRSDKVAAKFGVSPKYANRVYLAGAPAIVQRMAREANQRNAIEEIKAHEKRRELLKTCGNKPRESWSGLHAVTRYLATNLHDPDSITDLTCHGPWLTASCWVAQCKYRAKNRLGATVLSRKQFVITHGKVTGTEDLM